MWRGRFVLRVTFAEKSAASVQCIELVPCDKCALNFLSSKAISDWQPDPDNEGIDSKLNKTLADQLRDMALGFSLSQLSYVGFSHIHFDHVGVANEVKGATWLVQRGDYDTQHWCRGFALFL